MSDTEDTATASDPTPAQAAGGPMDVHEALQTVLKHSLISDGLARGLHESAKALDKRTAHFCVLAENCDEPQYVKLIGALCSEHNIPLIKVKDKKTLGEWVGLCKYDKEGKPRKIVPCSSCVVKDYGTKQDPALDVLQNYFASQQ